MTDDWPPKVLIAKSHGRGSTRVHHYPIAPGAYTPRCARQRADAREREYYRRDRKRYAEAYPLCSFCNPDVERERSDGDKTTWQKLAQVGDYGEQGDKREEADAFRERINAQLEQATEQSQGGDA